METICGQSKQVRGIKAGERGSKSAAYFPTSSVNKAGCGCIRELPAIVLVGGVLLVGDWRPDGAPLSFYLPLCLPPSHSVSPSLSPLNY